VRRVSDARGETGPPAQSRMRATYYSFVSVTLLLSTSDSAAAPVSPIWLSTRLQRGVEGQGCSWRDRVACESIVETTLPGTTGRPPQGAARAAAAARELCDAPC
jgi:hypothetical protein